MVRETEKKGMAANHHQLETGTTEICVSIKTMGKKPRQAEGKKQKNVAV